MKKIIKKIILQKIYSRYKELFSISIQEINDI
jgi:uncharacterized protein YlxP (DUF503 family)